VTGGLGAFEAALLYKLAQGFMDLYMEGLGKLVSETAFWRAIDKGYKGGKQSTMAREPDVLKRPKPLLVKTNNRGKRIEASAVGIAGKIVEFSKLSEDCQVGIGSEGLVELRKSSNLMFTKMVLDGGRVERKRSHYVRVRTQAEGAHGF